MITVAQIAEMFEDGLNALVPAAQNWSFKIWAEAGEYKNYIKQGNEVFYFINGSLMTEGSAITPNALIMGVNGLTLSFMVPYLTPKTYATQPASELQAVKDGQVQFIQTVGAILAQYFQTSRSYAMTDNEGNTFNLGMYAGVAIPNIIDLNPGVGKAVPMSVSITLNFVNGGANALDIKLYIDGERVPYLTLVPSRSSALSTDVQSNSYVQKHVPTSTVYALQFTCPSANSNAATAAYDYIAASETATAHFVELEWADQSDNVYLMVFTSANATATGAEFAGINANMGEAYEISEYFNYPDSFSGGAFTTSSSAATQLAFTMSANLSVTFAQNVTVPETYPFYYFIAGTAYKLLCSLDSSTVNEDGTTTAVYNLSENITVTLEPQDYEWSSDNQTYSINLVTSAAAEISNVASDFTYTEG